ncbi:MAG: hypothetical protein L0Y78_07430 [candidate division NC10 bacterium]|nr:hypothetical protein [candidate division NC10 bacterium]
MDAKRILLAGMVLVLAGACAWAAPEVSGFTPVPESDAAQIVGGDGYVCDTTLGHEITPPEFLPCQNNWNGTGCLYGAWLIIYPRYGCVPAESGDCYTDLYLHMEYGACGWYPESGGCIPYGEVTTIYVDACA